MMNDEKEKNLNTLTDIILKRSEKQTGRITFIESEENEEVLSYAELCRQARFVLFNLQEHGLKPGDELLFQFQTNKNFIITFWACVLGKIIPVPITLTTSGELKFLSICQSLQNPYIVTDYPDFNRLLTSPGNPATPGAPGLSPEPSGIKNRVIFYHHLRDNIKMASPVKSNPNDMVHIQFSSGSTSQPKGIILTHKNLLTNIRAMMKRVETPGIVESLLGWMPLTHDMGLIGFHIGPIVADLNHFLMPTNLFIRYPSLWLRKISGHKATIISSPNFGYKHLLQFFKPGKNKDLDLSSVRLIFNGAEPISAKLCKQFLDTMAPYGLKKNTMFPVYGLAEASLAVSFPRPGDELAMVSLHRDFLHTGQQVKEVKQGSNNAISFVELGTPVDNCQIKIADKKNNQVGERCIGRILVKGDNVTPGYYNNKEATDKAFTPDGWLDTGDLGFLENGQLVATGRAKELIIVGGINYYPHDIERSLEDIRGLETNKVAAVSVLDESIGRELVLVFVRAKINENNLKSFLPLVKQVKKRVFSRTGLIVDYVIPINKIPRTTSGKLQRFKLARDYSKGSFHSITAKIQLLEQQVYEKEKALLFTGNENKKNRIRAFLIKTAAQFIDNKEIDINKGLVEQGFDSMKAIQFQKIINNYFDLSLSISLVFDYPTISNITELIFNRLEKPSHVPAVFSGRTGKSSIDEPIAIIGIGCRFPPDADTPEKFWEMLEKGCDAVREIPSQRWNIKDFYSENTEVNGKMYTRYGAFLDDIETFDNTFFSITPKEAQHMDPQQRILLEVCYQSLENAGVNNNSLNNSNTGVFIGIANNDYARANASNHDYTSINQFSFTGTASSVAVGRISYIFGLQGPNYAIDTACSSSLVAVHAAVQSLKNRESDMALAGGINLMLTPDAFIASCKITALSKSRQARPFDNNADGYTRGEGCGIILLKRLSDAKKHQDNILAVIKGTAVNHDGKSSGLTAPNGLAQIKVISRSLANARILPPQVDYIEAHGSGTLIGDPQEVNALAAVFSQKREHKLLIGSVKSNIGHLEAAAGIAGLIKIILALNHKKIPASLHCLTPNQHIPWEKIPIAPVRQLTPWNVTGKPRIAGISSFGLSGTNVHVILQEAPGIPNTPDTTGKQEKISAYMLNLSAKTDHALKKLAQRYITFFQNEKSPGIRDISYTSLLSRGDFKRRISLIGSTKEEFRCILSGYLEKRTNTSLHQSLNWEPGSEKIAFLFSGQASQYTGMAMQLYETLPAFRQEMARCENIIEPLIGESIVKIVKTPGGKDKLNQPVFAHLALFSVEYALAKMWFSIGIRPAVLVGHSIGEYTAACLAGVFDLETALKLVHKRGQLMQVLPKNGLMMAVFSSLAVVSEIIKPYNDTIAVAAVNAPEIVILSGLRSTMNQIKNQLDKMNIYTTLMEVSRAFYSPGIESIIPQFEKFIMDMNIEFHNPSIPIISTVTGKKTVDNQLNKSRYWLDHMRSTIRFHEALNTAVKDDLQVFLEIGPTSTLTNLGKITFPDHKALWLACLNKTRHDWRQVLHVLGQLYVHQINLDWDKIAASSNGKKAVLPNYPLEKNFFPLDLLKPQLSSDLTSPPEKDEIDMEMMERQLNIIHEQLELLSKK